MQEIVPCGPEHLTVTGTAHSESPITEILYVDGGGREHSAYVDAPAWGGLPFSDMGRARSGRLVTSRVANFRFKPNQAFKKMGSAIRYTSADVISRILDAV